MKICHTEAMKMIKEFQEQKDTLISKEDENSIVSYKEGETKIDNGYDYKKTREAISLLDADIRKLKNLLAIANTKVVIEEFDMTIGEALVYLAQLQNEKMQMEELASKKQLSRRITQNGVIEYTECVYDLKEVEEDIKTIRKTINNLQMAIDRANLTNYIDF